MALHFSRHQVRDDKIEQLGITFVCFALEVPNDCHSALKRHILTYN